MQLLLVPSLWLRKDMAAEEATAGRVAWLVPGCCWCCDEVVQPVVATVKLEEDGGGFLWQRKKEEEEKSAEIG